MKHGMELLEWGPGSMNSLGVGRRRDSCEWETLNPLGLLGSIHSKKETLKYKCELSHAFLPFNSFFGAEMETEAQRRLGLTRTTYPVVYCYPYQAKAGSLTWDHSSSSPLLPPPLLSPPLLLAPPVRSCARSQRSCSSRSTWAGP